MILDFRTRENSKGFTLIELLVVISVIGLLSTFAIISLDNVRRKARDVKRRNDLKQLSTIVELYYDNNNSYPSTGGSWWSISVNGGSRATSGANAYIPGVTPTYIAKLPIDPNKDLSGWNGYLYNSNGIDYKILVHGTVETGYSANDPFYDPVRPTWAWAIYTNDGKNW